MNYLSYVLFLFCGVLICCNSEEDVPTDASYDCSFSKLENYTKTESEGFEHSLKVEGVLKANFKKISSFTGEVSVEDSIVFDRMFREETNGVAYSDSFLEKHNAIIDILCSIENDLRDSVLSEEEITVLKNSFWNKRDRYFDLLIGDNQREGSQTGETKFI